MYINATGINTVAASIMPRKPRLTIRKKKQGKIPVSQPVAVGIPSESGKLGVDNQKAVTSVRLVPPQYITIVGISNRQEMSYIS